MSPEQFIEKWKHATPPMAAQMSGDLKRLMADRRKADLKALSNEGFPEVEHMEEFLTRRHR
jgi:hypothetical protein|tara:strand:- start:388 stop:570 length:183 start_codon:yes stop_codon:yes gene_type:complete